LTGAATTRAEPGRAEEQRVFGGRFRAVRCLKQDGEVATLLGTDLELGTEVVIKTAAAAAVPPGVQTRLEHEAEVLRSVSSPYLTPLIEVGRQDGLLYLAMPFVPGVTLRERLAQGPLDAQDAVTVGVGIMAALREAHDKGVLHRDVKPANVIVDEQSPLHRVTLIDFGLSRSSRLVAPIRELPAGTAYYMSPEQAGLLNREVDERADLYSAGVVLFECLTGRPPFEGATVGEVLRQHVTARPPELIAEGVDVPRVLAEVVRHLLEKDPRDRYQTAAAAFADLGDIALALDRGDRQPRLVVGVRDRRSALTEPALVGREQELSLLSGELERAARGRSGLVSVEAESGGGKTRLLDELARQATRSGAWVLRGQGVDQAAQRPFQVLEGVVGEITAAAAGDERLGRRLRERLVGLEGAALAAFPQLESVLGTVESALLGPEEHGEARTVQALAALLEALGTEDRHALVLVDDCQWADWLTVQLLRVWQSRHGSGQGRHVLLVVAYRSEEVVADDPLRNLKPSSRMSLSPLKHEQVQRLAESMAGPLPPEALEVVLRLADGSPFMAAELVRGLVETGAIRGGAAGWEVDWRLMPDVQSSRRAAGMLEGRLERLPEPVLQLLSVGAVLGKEFDLDFACSLAGLTPHDAGSAARQARGRHFVFADAEGARYTFVHDRLREVLLDRLPERERRRLHQQAAEHIEAHDRERVFELAYHFDAGGAADRALPYALAAAQRARSRHTLEVAEQQCRIAERSATGADDATALRVAELTGDVLMLRGRYEEAAGHFERARSLARQPRDRAQIEGKLGELAFKRGDVRTASESLEAGLELLGERVPRRRLSLILRLTAELIVQFLHTLFPGIFLARRELAGAEDELLAVRLYSRLAYAYWFHRGKVPCGWAHLREMNLAERYAPGSELAQAYSEHAPVTTMVPYFRRGIAYAERSLEIRRTLGDRWGQGQSLHFYGVVLYGASRFEDAIAKCTEAVSILEQMGDPWEANTASWHIAFAQYRLGRLDEAVATARRVRQAALEIGDDQAAAISLGAWSKASAGQIPAGLTDEALGAVDDDAHASVEVLQAEAVRLLGSGSAAAAIEVLEHACRRVRDAGVRQEYVAPVRPWLVTALRREAERTPPWDPGRRSALLRRARRESRRALRIASRYRNNLPHALRERALVAAMEGRTGRARRLLDRSLQEADHQEARHEYAQTLAARGELGRSLGWEGAEQQANAGKRALEEIGAARDGAGGSRIAEQEEPTLALLHRFTAVVDAGRRIVTALSREEVLAAVREAGVSVLHAEDSTVVELIGKDGRELPADPGADQSMALVERALAEGGPVVFEGALGLDPAETTTISQTRSAICAPIAVRGRIVACLYARHEHVGGLFGEEERSLAGFVAALAGAALESADSFAEVRALSGSLQRRAEELERSNSDLQQFAHAASHDLSEPLRMVSSYLQLLAKRYGGRLDSQADEFIETAVEGAARMQALIDGLLVYSRAGTAEYDLGEVDCGSVVEQCLASLKARVDETGATVTVGDLPALRADETQLGQLFQNLLSNALKFVADGPPRATISADRAHGAWQFRVTDNGIGIEPRHAGRIFTVFKRLQGHEEYPGSGIGLAICKRIVERHGGRIWVESASGGGSSFCFTIPDPDSQ
jgi:signal transduction histidine kinase/tetratricopeptide (TPR) repeat protein